MSRGAVPAHQARLSKTTSAHPGLLRTSSYGLARDGRAPIRLDRARTHPFPVVRYPQSLATEPGEANGLRVAGARCSEGTCALDGLDEFLAARGLSHHSTATARWCQEMGAAYIEEVMENLVDLADSLGLSQTERSRLFASVQNPVRTLTSDEVKGSATSLRTMPIAGLDAGSGAKVVARCAGVDAGDAGARSGEQSGVTLQAATPNSVEAKPAVVLSVQPARTVTLNSSQRVSNTSPTGGFLSSGADSMLRTRTSPTTASEVQGSRLRAESAYVPLHEWSENRMRVASGASSVNGNFVGVTHVSRPLDTQGAKPLAPMGLGHEETLTASERLVETTEGLPGSLDRKIWNMNHRYRMWDPTRGYVEPHLLRQRVPTDAELAHPFAKEAAEARASKAAMRSQHVSFEHLRSQFFKDHGGQIKQNLSKCFEGKVSISPAPVSKEVQQRFMEGYVEAPMGDIIPTYHGSDAKNYSSICERGLLIPGKGNELRVEHGAAHGRGIYTARVGAPGLSQGFCTEPTMLICGVVDDADAHLGGEACGRFEVSAKSDVIKHVGNAVVVADEKRVAPLFQVSADAFSNAASSSGPPGGSSTTLSSWMNGRMPLPGQDTPIAAQPQELVHLGKGKALHVPSGQIAFLPPTPETGYGKYGIKQKRIYETRKRDRTRDELRAEKAAWQNT